jgi:hypothetical protein
MFYSSNKSNAMNTIPENLHRSHKTNKNQKLTEGSSVHNSVGNNQITTNFFYVRLTIS